MNTKICSKCKQEKPLTEFHFKAKEKRHNSFCKPCLHAYQVERWVRIKKRAIAYKGASCTACGQSFPYPAMQFHHRDPREKDVAWTKLRLRSWTRIVEELDKCDLVCANCHAVIHSSA